MITSNDDLKLSQRLYSVCNMGVWNTISFCSLSLLFLSNYFHIIDSTLQDPSNVKNQVNLVCHRETSSIKSTRGKKVDRSSNSFNWFPCVKYSSLLPRLKERRESRGREEALVGSSLCFHPVLLLPLQIGSKSLIPSEKDLVPGVWEKLRVINN